MSFSSAIWTAGSTPRSNAATAGRTASESAINWISRDLKEKTVTFAELRDQSSRFANLLRSRGIGRGDVVGGLLPRIPELFVVALGAWRVGALYQPLFTAFGPAAIESRVTSEGGSQAKLIVTDAANRPKLDDVADRPPVLLVDRGGDRNDFATALAAQVPECSPVMLSGGDPFVILFTSGTTGKPKGVRWPLNQLLNIGGYMRMGSICGRRTVTGTSPIQDGRTEWRILWWGRYFWAMRRCSMRAVSPWTVRSGS